MVEATIISREAHDHFATATEKNTFHGEYTADSVIVTVAIAIALYNCLELSLLITSTFKRWKGLYFWSLSISNVGVFLYALGMMLGYFVLCKRWVWKVILDIGWVSMLTFQSLVLYSRLGLIIANSNILAGVKWMIIVNSMILCTIVVIFDFGSTYSGLASFAAGYYYVEQIQLIMFTVQELIISGLYVSKTIALLKVISKDNTRTMIAQLLVMNIIIICMDTGIVALEFLHYQLYQEVLKGFVYSVKLKLELNILSKLVDLVNDNNTRRNTMTMDVIDSQSIAGNAQIAVQKELSDYGGLTKSDTRTTVEKIEEGAQSGPSCSGSSAQTGDDHEVISRVLSNSRYSTRTTGRESDILYAGFLKDMR